MSCQGRVVIVTGAGRGLGRSHVELLAREGARVVVNDLGVERDGSLIETSVAEQVAADLRSAGLVAIASRHDVSDWSQAADLVKLAVEQFGTLDAIVNNAGILRDRMIVNMSAGEWDDVLRVHLRGTAAMLHHASVYWRARYKAGESVSASVVNTTSPSGLFGKPGQSNYGAAKAAIATLSMIAAEELGRYGVTVNAVAPVALTRMTSDLIEDPATADLLAPEHVSPMVAWLCGTESRKVTGRVFEVSGKRWCLVDPWRRGPQLIPQGVFSVDQVGQVVADFLAHAAPAEMMGGNL